MESQQQWSLGQKARTVYTELSGMANNNLFNNIIQHGYTAS